VHETRSGMIVTGDEVKEVERLKYLRSFCTKERCFDKDVKHRIRCEWRINLDGLVML